MAENKKREQLLKGNRRNHKEINRRNPLHMIANKGLPALQWPIWSGHHIDRNRGLGDLDAELEQLAMDLGGAPHGAAGLLAGGAFKITAAAPSRRRRRTSDQEEGNDRKGPREEAADPTAVDAPTPRPPRRWLSSSGFHRQVQSANTDASGLAVYRSSRRWLNKPVGAKIDSPIAPDTGKVSHKHHSVRQQVVCRQSPMNCRFGLASRGQIQWIKWTRLRSFSLRTCQAYWL